MMKSVLAYFLAGLRKEQMDTRKRAFTTVQQYVGRRRGGGMQGIFEWQGCLCWGRGQQDLQVTTDSILQALDLCMKNIFF